MPRDQDEDCGGYAKRILSEYSRGIRHETLCNYEAALDQYWKAVHSFTELGQGRNVAVMPNNIGLEH